jgi:hypothetical protein
LSIIPDEIVAKYNLQAILVAGWVYIEIRKGMYGLKQEGLLLQQRLEPYGYYPARHTPGLWLHKTRPITFTLVVYDFAVKCVGKENAHHVRNALLHSYDITTYLGGTIYSGMTLKWDYQKRTCDISMPGCVANFLNKFQHDNQINPQHTPPKFAIPVYGLKTSTQPEMRHRSYPQSSALTSKISQDQFYTTRGQ